MTFLQWAQRRSLRIVALGTVMSGLLLYPGSAEGIDRPKGYQNAALTDSRVLEAAKEYSRKAVAEDPVLRELLDRTGFEYLHQLNPRKIYTINRGTKQVSIAEATDAPPIGTAGIFFGLGSVVTTIRAAGGDILGMGKTVITCPFGPQTADVKGFMASTVSRDPVGGIKNGSIVVDDFLTTAAQVDFRILNIPGGAKNPMNRTVMETTHMGTCGAEAKVQNVVSTWPPLRIELTVDDTGSMSNELSGVQAALTNFIRTHNTDLDKTQRGVSYELISFKDSPTLRLAETEDQDAAIGAVNSLFPSGGGDCPEDSVGALGMALDNLTGDEDSAGEIVLVTDASPHSGDIEPIVAKAKSLDVPIHVMLSGDCVTSAVGPAAAATDVPSARDVFERLARETGGLYFFKPGGSVADYTEILEKIFETAAVGSDKEPPTVTVEATPTIIWPPNHKMVRLDTHVSAVDNRDLNPVISLVGVTSSELDNGQGDGSTPNEPFPTC